MVYRLYNIDLKKDHGYRIVLRSLLDQASLDRMSPVYWAAYFLWEKLYNSYESYEYGKILYGANGGIETTLHKLLTDNINDGDWNKNDRSNNSNYCYIVKAMNSIIGDLVIDLHDHPEYSPRFYKAFRNFADQVSIGGEEMGKIQLTDRNGDISLKHVFRYIEDHWQNAASKNETYRFLDCLTGMIDWNKRERPYLRAILLEAIREMTKEWEIATIKRLKEEDAKEERWT